MKLTLAIESKTLMYYSMSFMKLGSRIPSFLIFLSICGLLKSSRLSFPQYRAMKSILCLSLRIYTAPSRYTWSL